MQGKRTSRTYHVWECLMCDARVEREWEQSETRAEFDAAVRHMGVVFQEEHAEGKCGVAQPRERVIRDSFGRVVKFDGSGVHNGIGSRCR